MMLRILLLTSALSLVSCKTDVKEDSASIEQSDITKSKDNSEKENTPLIDKKDLVVIENGTFKEYYPNKKIVKFEGPQDKNGKRNGKWQYFSESGIELSMTIYRNGQKHGHSIVKYPNGNLHYTGEYSNNKQVGVWKTYSIEGDMMNEVDYNKL